MKKYEFRTATIDSESQFGSNANNYYVDKLNELGNEGWMVVCKLESIYCGIELLLQREIRY